MRDRSNRRIRIGAGLFVLAGLTIVASAWAGDGGPEGHSVILNIALCMVSASLLGLLMKLARQPVILGHILAGILIGPIGIGLITDNVQIVTISEIGLILLLFMIGLEIDLHKMLAAGKLIIIPGLVQFPVCLALGYAAIAALEGLGFSVGPGSFARLYCAVAISISSTMIVVKLLYDKFELDTLAGRITVGILVFQDIWAIIVLALQPNLADPAVVGILQTFGTGALLVVVSLAVSKYLLPHVFRTVAKLPELLLVMSLGWCFLVALVASHPRVGLSMEMGALIAGISLATFPYNLDVLAKVVSIRDFFITLFFVALGMQIPLPELNVVLTALVLTAVALAIRIFGVFWVLYPLKTGHRVSLLTTINLNQISEFSLVILTLGVGYGHVESKTITYVIWVFSLMAVGSTYLIMYSHELQGLLSKLLIVLGIKDVGGAEEGRPESSEHPVVVLGFYRVASALLNEISRNAGHLLDKIKVVDFNPLVKDRLAKMGVACVYGDISHVVTLAHAEIANAKVVLCTIPDYILKGTTNLKLFRLVKAVCPNAKVILTSEGPTQAKELFDAGADYVIQPSALAGSAVVGVIEQALEGRLDELKDAAVTDLAERTEVLS